MNQKILINNTESIFTYYGESLDLMNSPDISNFKMYNLYHLFINNVLCIYKTNKSNKNIPVFWTIINNTEKLDRIPHPNSTLRRLDNNESYFIKLINNADLPIEIPQPIDINSISCLNPNESCKNNEQNACCSTPYIVGESFRNIQLTDSYFSNITVPLSGLLPNKKYFYKIDNNFSNWPAKIHPYSGFLERSGPTNDQLELTANLEFVFSYLAEEDVGNIQVTTPTTDTSNIFTFLTLSLWQEGCDDKTLLSDTINISCKNCLTSLPVFDSLNLDEYSIQSVGDCATIKFDNDNIVTTVNKTSLKLFYQDLDISKTYSYIISAKEANWPLSISSNSGILIPKEIYASGNKLYGSGTIDLNLHFNNTYEEPYIGWSNLDYVLDDNFNLKLIKENIYTNLEAKILTNNCSNTDKAMIFCDDCIEDNEYDCIKDANVNIKNTNANYYPLNVQRPGAEAGIDLSCCPENVDLNISLSNICPEQEYLFRIDSYPPIDILPNSGSFFSSSNTFEIKALANLGNTPATNIKCNIEHKNSQYSVSDSMILRCKYCEWQLIKILEEIYASGNYTQGYYKENLITGNQDGSLIIAAIPSGYLYRSEDYGINWTPLTANGKKLWSSIAFSESTNETYLTTGRYLSSSTFVEGEFMKSSDIGENFNKIDIDVSLSKNLNFEGTFNDEVNTIAIQFDGKILVGGRFASYSSSSVGRIARLNTNGTIDSTFRTGTGANNTVLAIANTSNQNIMIGGTFNFFNGTPASRLVLLNSSGSAIRVFSPNLGSAHINNAVHTIRYVVGSYLLIGGDFTTAPGTGTYNIDNRIARLSINNYAYDSTFRVGSGFNATVRVIEIQSDTKILVGGSFTLFDGTNINRIARLNFDGTLDNTFTVGSGFNASVRTIVIQSDGKILVGGDFTTYNETNINRIARLNSDGTLDDTFTVGSGFDFSVKTIAIQSDGKILVGGDFTKYNDISAQKIVVLSSDGLFNITTGLLALSGSSSVNSIVNMTLNDRPSICIGGSFLKNFAVFSRSAGFNGLSISNNGNYIVLVGSQTLDAYIIYSTDSGLNFFLDFIPVITEFFISETSVADNGSIALSLAQFPENTTYVKIPLVIKNINDTTNNWITIYPSEDLSTSRISKYSGNGSTLISYIETPTRTITISKDNGVSWQTKAFNMSPVIINNSRLSNDGSRIILITNTSTMFKSIDYGENWTRTYITDPSDTNKDALDLFAWDDNTSLASINRYNDQYSINLYKCPLN